jgi:hypothetical protein
MDSFSWEVDGQAPEAKEGIRRVEVRNKVRNNEYALEIFDDAHGDTWVRVRTGTTVSQPIPFADFVVGNQ